ncbi:hypothetical protein [Fluviispira multicolorata]|uniref:Uncharacterized protein n=1 Tax=Fluviispira multicolorata TaxID=2654512 RepID=A0A833JGV9_9BACT|nr:hypothetical protein [Fluviispira multicolorata]KAB8032236.1 hypothetical protein GCL57_06200 [Fluviispira multicolorata]
MKNIIIIELRLQNIKISISVKEEVSKNQNVPILPHRSIKLKELFSEFIKKENITKTVSFFDLQKKINPIYIGYLIQFLILIIKYFLGN